MLLDDVSSQTSDGPLSGGPPSAKLIHQGYWTEKVRDTCSSIRKLGPKKFAFQRFVQDKLNKCSRADSDELEHTTSYSEEPSIKETSLRDTVDTFSQSAYRVNADLLEIDDGASLRKEQCSPSLSHTSSASPAVSLSESIDCTSPKMPSEKLSGDNDSSTFRVTVNDLMKLSVMCAIRQEMSRSSSTSLTGTKSAQKRRRDMNSTMSWDTKRKCYPGSISSHAVDSTESMRISSVSKESFRVPSIVTTNCKGPLHSSEHFKMSSRNSDHFRVPTQVSGPVRRPIPCSYVTSEEPLNLSMSRVPVTSQTICSQNLSTNYSSPHPVPLELARTLVPYQFPNVAQALPNGTHMRTAFGSPSVQYSLSSRAPARIPHITKEGPVRHYPHSHQKCDESSMYPEYFSYPSAFRIRAACLL